MEEEPNRLRLPPKETTGRGCSPVEYGTIMGMALAASGLGKDLIGMLVVYFLLKRLRPAAGFELTFVASIFLGPALSLFFQPAIFKFKVVLLMVIVSAATIALFTTEKRIWAWLLLVYLALEATLGTMQVLFALFDQAGTRSQGTVFTMIAWVGLWQLMKWMRMQTAIAAAREKPIIQLPVK